MLIPENYSYYGADKGQRIECLLNTFHILYILEYASIEFHYTILRSV
jgi:hypothetical protein